MTSKTIDIDEETYKRLLKKKKENETFSQLIDKLLGEKEKKKPNLKPFIGRWKELPQEYFEIMEVSHEEIRNEINKRFQ
ncbi:MAG: hypothetical protein JW891_00245 [Candidatus Lokiarchaeota archaeon]|nr:hypothetical protein [Candidatus Lokiarchaeota archaeon]